MQVLADEEAASGRIRVNTLNPGPTRTAMHGGEAYPDEDPMKLPTPEEIAPAFLRLLAPSGRASAAARSRRVDAAAASPPVLLLHARLRRRPPALRGGVKRSTLGGRELARAPA